MVSIHVQNNTNYLKTYVVLFHSYQALDLYRCTLINAKTIGSNLVKTLLQYHNNNAIITRTVSIRGPDQAVNNIPST
jgi:predicted neuraminidase